MYIRMLSIECTSVFYTMACIYMHMLATKSQHTFSQIKATLHWQNSKTY